MSFGTGCKTALVDLADPATPDTLVQTTVGDSWDGVIEKSKAANVFSGMKMEYPRQALCASALEQMERIFNVVESLFHRRAPKDIV